MFSMSYRIAIYRSYRRDISIYQYIMAALFKIVSGGVWSFVYFSNSMTMFYTEESIHNALMQQT